MNREHPFGSSSEPLSPELEARLRLAIEPELDKPFKPWGFTAAVFAILTLLMFGASSVVFDLTVKLEKPVTDPLWVQSLALLAVALVAGVVGLAPWRQRTAWPLVLGVLVSGVVLATQVSSIELAPFTPHAGCFAWEVGCSILPAGFAVMVARQHAPHLGRAMVLGSAAGTMSLALMHLKCPYRDVGHVLLFHLAPLLLVVVATLFVRRTLSTTSYAP
jgi:hypothetical protein